MDLLLSTFLMFLMIQSSMVNMVRAQVQGIRTCEECGAGNVSISINTLDSVVTFCTKQYYMQLPLESVIKGVEMRITDCAREAKDFYTIPKRREISADLLVRVSQGTVKMEFDISASETLRDGLSCERGFTLYERRLANPFTCPIVPRFLCATMFQNTLQIINPNLAGVGEQYGYHKFEASDYSPSSKGSILNWSPARDAEPGSDKWESGCPKLSSMTTATISIFETTSDSKPPVETETLDSNLSSNMTGGSSRKNQTSHGTFDLSVSKTSYNFILIVIMISYTFLLW